MGKRGKKRAGAARKGLLGQCFTYVSSEDEDYLPEGTQRDETLKPQAPPPAKRSRKKAATRAPPGLVADDDADSSDSGETLAARFQKRRAAAGQPSATAAGAAAAPIGSGTLTSWGQLPNVVLAQIFQRVCHHNALPMAPVLCCVCRGWQAAVAAAPELWLQLDFIPGITTKAKSERQRQKLQASLRRWLKGGWLKHCRQLAISSPPYDEFSESAAVPSHPSFLSGPLLQQLAQEAGGVTQLALSGVPNFSDQELISALACLPGLREVTFKSCDLKRGSSLDKVVQELLQRAAAGQLLLTKLVVEDAPGLGPATVAVLCRPQAAAAEASGLVAEPQPAGSAPPPAAAGPPPATAAVAVGGALGAAGSPISGSNPWVGQGPGGPFRALLELDLTCSGRPGMSLHIERLQAAAPNLRVLRLGGLGRRYGWVAKPAQVTLAQMEASPGFVHLHTLDVSALNQSLLYMTPTPGSAVTYSDVTDEVLTRLVGKSPGLTELDVSGTRVTPAGFRALVAQLGGLGGGEGGRGGGSPGARRHLGQQQTNGVGGGLLGPSGGVGAVATGSREPAAAPAAGIPGGGAAASGITSSRQRGELVTVPPLARVYCLASRVSTDEGLEMLGDFFSDTLKELAVGKAGATPAYKLPGLSTVTDTGLRSLRACVGLKSLDVRNTSVTDEGLHDLLQAVPGLEYVDVESCRGVSREARAAAAKGIRQLRACFDGM